MPTRSTCPSARATGTSYAPARERLLAERDGALIDQPPGLGAGELEELGDDARQVDDAVVGLEAALLDLLGLAALDEDAVELALGGERRPADACSQETSSRASSRLASRGADPGGQLAVEQQPVVLGHRLVGDAQRLAVDLAGGSVIPMWLPSDLDILRCPSVPTRIGIVRIACSGCP